MKKILIYDTLKDSLEKVRQDLEDFDGEVTHFKNNELLGQLHIEVER